MTFGFQLFRLTFQTTGVFFVNLSLSFQRTPVRGDLRYSVGNIFLGRTGRNPGKDTGGYRSAKGSIMTFRLYLPYLINGYDSPLWLRLHNAVHLQW